MPHHNLSPQDHLPIMYAAAQAGGEMVKKYFGKIHQISQKSLAADLKTEADTESEKKILAVLTKNFPDYNIVAEESGQNQNNSPYTFTVDPLDGTNNFVLGVPNFTISIALLNQEKIVAGLTYQPIINQTYWASLGGGSFLNNSKLAVSTESEITRSTIGYTKNYLAQIEHENFVYSVLNERGVKRVLRNWSAAFDFCLLAAGKIEGMVHNGCELYDFAAGKLITKEAGAIVTTFDNTPDSDKNGVFLVSNHQNIHDHLVEIVSYKKSLQFAPAIVTKVIPQQF